MARTPPPANNRFAKFTGICKSCGAEVKDSARCKCGAYFKADGTPTIGGRNAKSNATKKEKPTHGNPKKEAKQPETTRKKSSNSQGPKTEKPWYDRPVFGEGFNDPTD